MGREVDRILDQLERSFRTEAWHGPSVIESLEGVEAAQAAKRPLQGAHTIWELVLHMTYWKDIVRRRLAGERPETDDAMNFPVVTDASDSAWARVRADLEATHEALRTEVARLEDEDLESPAPGGTVARYIVTHGIVQHDLYHAGQISILKKPQKTVPRTAAAKPRRASRVGRKAVAKKTAPKKSMPRKSASRSSKPKRASGAGRKSRRR